MKKLISGLFLFLVLFFASSSIIAQNAEKSPAPQTDQQTAQKPENLDLNKTVAGSMPLQIIVLLTLLSFIPAGFNFDDVLYAPHRRFSFSPAGSRHAGSPE